MTPFKDQCSYHIEIICFIIEIIEIIENQLTNIYTKKLIETFNMIGDHV